MVVVIDASSKLVGFNLFESFFYKLKSEGTLVFANNPLTVDDLGVNYKDLKYAVQDILYDNHASSWSLCVLYDMNEQKEDPIRNSIAANIHDIKENIIKPLSQDYSFDKLYYFSLDNIRRNFDGIPVDENVNTAIAFDSMGYLSAKTDSKYADILFLDKELEAYDEVWEEIKNKNLSKDGMTVNNPKQIINDFKQKLNLSFDVKINEVYEKYSDLSWYASRLDKVYKTVVRDFENDLFKHAGSANSIQSPSKYLKNAFKMEVSTYRERESVIIHINLDNKTSTLNREVLKYRYQLEILALLIYLATNDTKLIFEGGQSIGRENHWEITTFLNDANLSKMLNSYNSKLKTELDKIGKYPNSEIEYEEFAPRTFNLAMEMKKPEIPSIPSFALFSNKGDGKKVEHYSEGLYKRYIKGIEYANRRMRELTTKLRVQKESESSGKVKKGNVREISAELEKMQKDIKSLQQKIVFYHPGNAVSVNKDVKDEYKRCVNKIMHIMSKRIKLSTFVKNILLVIGTSLCTYPVLQLTTLTNKTMLMLSAFMLVVPAAIYSLIQLSYLFMLKNEITKSINKLRSSNEAIVNDLYYNDNNASKFIQDIYNLIMQKKYVSECNAKVIASNRKLKQYNYHHDKLKEHVEVSDQLIMVLGIETSNSELVNIDKIDGVKDVKSVESNSLYCPLNYLLVGDQIKNKAIINEQKNVDIDSNLIGFVEKFVIVYDKEYCND